MDKVDPSSRRVAFSVKEMEKNVVISSEEYKTLRKVLKATENKFDKIHDDIEKSKELSDSIDIRDWL